MTLTKNQQIWQQIKEAKNIAICFDSQNHNLLSAMALDYFLKNSNKNVSLFTTNDLNTKKFKFLKYPIHVNTEFKIEYLSQINVSLDKNSLKTFKYSIEKTDNNETLLNIKIATKNKHITTRDLNLGEKTFNYDLIITINTPDLDILESLYKNNLKFFKHTNLINIDINPENELYGDINLVEINEKSTTNLIYKLYKEISPQLLNKTSSSLLLAAFLLDDLNEDSKSRHGNFINEMIENGADYHEIKTELFYNKDENYLNILGQILKNIEINDGILTTVIPKQLNLEEKYLQEILPQIINDLLKHVRGIKTIIVSAEFTADWKHIVYKLKAEGQNWKNLIQKYHILGMNDKQIVISSPLESIEIIHEKIRQILNA